MQVFKGNMDKCFSIMHHVYVFKLKEGMASEKPLNQHMHKLQELEWACTPFQRLSECRRSLTTSGTF